MRLGRLTIWLILGGFALVGCRVETPRPTPITVIVPTREGTAGEVVATQPAFVADAPDQTAVPAASPTASGVSIPELLAGNPDFVLLLSNLNRTGVIATLQGPGPYTLFAPTNAAFTQLGLASTQIDAAVLEEVLRYHVVEGVASSADLQAGTSLTTLAGVPVTIGEGARVEYATVTGADMAAANGVVHAIDAILLPPEQGERKSVWGTLVDDGRFTRFVQLAQDARLLYNLRFGTIDAVLAPTDEAFAQLPADIETLLEEQGAKEHLVAYHILAPYGWPRGEDLTVASIGERERIETLLNYGSFGFGVGIDPISVVVDGEQVYVDTVPITEGNIDASNGIIHVLETVLLPVTLGDQLGTP